MLNFQESNTCFEEEVIFKLKHHFINKYQIEHCLALNMAIDFFEVFSIKEEDLILLNKFYLQ